MALSWKKRLRIPLEGNPEPKFFTKSGTLVAIGYRRVVIGGRGPYIEFHIRDIQWNEFYVPEEEQYRATSGAVFYEEWRSIDASFVKLYLQKRRVAYADYKPGMVYISPFDLLSSGKLPTIV